MNAGLRLGDAVAELGSWTCDRGRHLLGLGYGLAVPRERSCCNSERTSSSASLGVPTKR
jgi:hypothetical protein